MTRVTRRRTSGLLVGAMVLAVCRRRRRSAERAVTSATTRSSSACSTTSPASTRTCPAPTASSPSRWRSPTTRPSTATRRSPRTIEVVTADHQNKPDIANTKAQEMYDRQNADIILDVPTSSAALAVADRGQGSKKKLFIDVGAGTTALTGAACNTYTFHWAYDTAMLANGTGSRGHQERRQELEHRLPRLRVRPGHEEVLHRSGRRMPAARCSRASRRRSRTTTSPPSSPRPPRANPDVIGTMQAGGDLVNFVKQYNESGLRDKGVKLAVGLMFITDIHSLGVDQFAGTPFTDAWYWNFDDDQPRLGRQVQGEDRHPALLRARRQLLGGAAVPRGRPAGRHRRLRRGRQGARGQEDQRRLPAQRRGPRADHNVIHDAYLAKVKTKDQVKEPWDYEEITNTIPAKDAYGPVSTECKL